MHSRMRLVSPVSRNSVIRPPVIRVIRPLMSEALEQTITVDRMADLLAYLKNWRYLDGCGPLGDAAKP